MQRHVMLDLLKIVLAVMVVGIHGLEHDPRTTVLIVLKDYVFRIAVPVFLLINGYFLATRLDDFERFKAWLIRIAILYLFWMAIYVPIMMQDDIAQHASPVKMVFHLAINFVFGFHHLWYLAAVFWAGIALYLMRGWPERSKIILAIGLYAAGVALQYGAAYVPGDTRLGHLLNVNFLHRNAVFFGFPMLYLGYLIARYPAEARSRTWIAMTAGMALLLIECSVNLMTGNQADMDLLVFIPPLSAGLFLLALNARDGNLKSNEYIARLSSVIYFIHPLLVEHLLLGVLPNSIARIAATLAICCAVAPLLIWANRWPTRQFKVSLV